MTDDRFSEEYELVEHEGLPPAFVEALRAKYGGTQLWKEFAGEHGIDE